jgi:hypothetical protein
MELKSSVLGGTATALAGLLMLGATALAQDQGGSYGAPSPSSQPPTSEPGQSAQPNGPADQQQMTQPSQSASPSQMSSPSSSTMNANAGEPLSHVKDAKTTLASATVQDSTGQPVGQVADVHTSKHGTPTTIDVSLQSNASGQAKTVAIKASKLRYDQSSNTLKADLTATDIQSLPTASGM